MTMDSYFDALDGGLEPVVPYIFRIPKSNVSSSCSPIVLNLFRRSTST